jgi:DNA-binding NtrC family response regulator
MMNRIVIVDGEVEACKALQELLTLKGYEVAIILDGAKAITKLKQLRPQIVLLELKLPSVDGIDILRKIKRIYPELPVVIVTVVKDPEVAKEALSLGAFEYITKPVDIDYLELVVLAKIVELMGPGSHPDKQSKNE